MGDKTGIEWTDATWNPVVGCAHVSTGCDNCYAAREAAGRLSGLPQYQGLSVRRPGEAARFTGEVRCLPERLDQPLRWKRPRRVFVNSMSDLFHGDVPVDYIAQVFAVMAVARQHTFQVLTKRPQRMAYILDELRSFRSRVDDHMTGAAGGYAHLETENVGWPLPNVWLGASIESDRYTWRADHLRRTPAAVRWISAEPLVGPLPSLDLAGIDWVVAGGESGPGARPMHPDWVRELRDRCANRDVAFLFKQWGEWAPVEGDGVEAGRYVGREDGQTYGAAQAGGVLMSRLGKRAAGRELDGRTWDEYPE